MRVRRMKNVKWRITGFVVFWGVTETQNDKINIKNQTANTVYGNSLQCRRVYTWIYNRSLSLSLHLQFSLFDWISVCLSSHIVSNSNVMFSFQTFYFNRDLMPVSFSNTLYLSSEMHKFSCIIYTTHSIKASVCASVYILWASTT